MVEEEVETLLSILIQNKILIEEEITEYITVSIGDAVIGRLYAGDFLWMPWSPRAQHVNDIEITPSVATGMYIEFMAIHNFANIYPDSADS